VFAAILQASESFSKVSCRHCTAEVRGSNPLGSTLENRYFAGKTQVKNKHSHCQPSPCAGTAGKPSMISLSGVYAVRSSGIAQISWFASGSGSRTRV
jgi:hypothetical protein